MKRRALSWLALAALYLLHNDVWFWWRPDLVGGLPVGLVYHVTYCLIVALSMGLLVCGSWPEPERD